MSRALRLLLLPLLLGQGCAHRPEFDPRLLDEVFASAAAQVKRCYRFPRVEHVARQISTRLRVRFAPDGSLAGLPQLAWQSGVSSANRHHAAAMAQAATLAVIRCAPLRLPPEAYRGWREFDLSFSVSVAA